jgi:hypothetical protein
MTATAKPITPSKTRDLKGVTVFAFAKLGENLIEISVTMIVAALTIAYLNLQGVLPSTDVAVYIALIFLGVQLRRLVQDFDDSISNDEIAERVDIMFDMVKQIYRRQRNEGTLDDDDIDERLQSIMEH